MPGHVTAPKVASLNFKNPFVTNTERAVAWMKFTYGKKQTVNNVELDELFKDLQSVLQKHPLAPKENVNELVSEWINDLLFLAGKITEKAVTYAKEHGLKIKPVCTYSVQFFKKHTEYKELLS